MCRMIDTAVISHSIMSGHVEYCLIPLRSLGDCLWDPYSRFEGSACLPTAPHLSEHGSMDRQSLVFNKRGCHLADFDLPLEKWCIMWQVMFRSTHRRKKDQRQACFELRWLGRPPDGGSEHHSPAPSSLPISLWTLELCDNI